MRYDYNKPFEKFLKMEIATIINTFNKTNTRNLRVLKHALNDFERIYDNVTREYPNVSNDMLKTILIFTIAISFEIKVGNVVKAKFSSVKSNEEYKTILFTSNILNGSSQYYLREFDTRYFLNCKEEYRFFIIPEKQSELKEFIDIPVDWTKIIKEIRIDERCSDVEKEAFVAFCNNYNIPEKKIIKLNLHENPQPKITIE